ncbi:hypothetical protein KAU11_10090 [Candidatus Babeliales bacterium]|nr:hypothetical protein [Candidatus Babeliales bacterium]
MRETDRNRNIELLNVVTSPIKRTILEQNAVDTLENSAKQKEDLKKYYDLELTFVVTQMEAEISQMRATIAQTNAQTKQIEQQVSAGAQEQEATNGGAQQGSQQPQQQDQGGEQSLPAQMNNQLKQ